MIINCLCQSKLLIVVNLTFHKKTCDMHKNLLQKICSVLLFMMMLSAGGVSPAVAQYVSPGDDISFSLDDLVEVSDGVVSEDEEGFLISDDITISASDRLEILETALVRLEAGVRINILGGFTSDPVAGKVTFTAVDTLSLDTSFNGFRFEDAEPALFRNTIVKYGGGIQLIGTPAEFDQSVFRNNSASNVSAAITYSGSSPVITNSEFIENERAAIGSGANVSGSPQIIGNRFIHNVTDNSNRPQLNLGPGAAGDSLRIEGNYIEGLNDNAGGIGLSNLLGAGATLAAVRDNEIINNRYGIAQIGSPISSVIEDNIIQDNDIQGNPNLGGSGINFNASGAGNTTVARRNVISGNLWGVTIQGEAQPSFGTEESPGENAFYENGNGGTTYALFNNTAGEITAIGNYWGENDEEFAASVIFDQGDGSSVSFLPINTIEAEFDRFNFLTEDNPGLEEDVIGVIDAENQLVELLVPPEADLSNLLPDIGLQTGVSLTPDAGERQDFSAPVSYSLSIPHEEIAAEWDIIISTPTVPGFAQFVHSAADPALSSVDVYINGDVFFEDFAFREATALTALPSETELLIELTAAGESEVAYETTITLQANSEQRLFIAGLSNPDAFTDNPSGADTALETFLVPLADPPAEGNSNVTIGHFSTDAPAVDVREEQDDSFLISSLGYGDITATLPLPTDSYRLLLFPADEDELLAAYQLDLTTLETDVFVFASGFLNPAENQDGPAFTLLAVDNLGQVVELNNVTSTPPSEQPQEFALEQNYPNPFNPATNIRFSLPEAGEVSLSVYNVQGQRVATLTEGSRSAGTHQISFNAGNLASGVYLYRLQTESATLTRKMMLVK